MKVTLLKLLSFLLVNMMAGWVHIQLFQSHFPFVVFASITLHAIALIFFPYQTFKPKKK